MTVASLMLLTMAATFLGRTTALRILYPKHPLEPKRTYDEYQPEYSRCLEKGIDCSLFSEEAFEEKGTFRPKPAVEPNEAVLYRGWMMTPTQYQAWGSHLETAYGANLITSVADYTKCHHLPGWYAECAKLTAETHFLPGEPTKEDIFTFVDDHGLAFPLFVKDYVKSNSADKGSIAKSSEDIVHIMNQLKERRGMTEGGIALRRLEAYAEDSEQRFFVANRKPYGPNGDVDAVPAIVQAVADSIQAPFYSVDIAQTLQGDWRLVELGDGQVSDKKDWPLDRFVDVVLSSL